MAKRKQTSGEKSKPFTTVILYLPVRISICGNSEFQKKWKKFFNSKKNTKTKSEFILDNLRRDYGVKKISDLFDDSDSRRWDRKKLEGILVELKYPNIQEYLSFILDRAEEEKNVGVKGESS